MPGVFAQHDNKKRVSERKSKGKEKKAQLGPCSNHATFTAQPLIYTQAEFQVRFQVRCLAFKMSFPIETMFTGREVDPLASLSPGSQYSNGPRGQAAVSSAASCSAAPVRNSILMHR